MTTGSTGRKTSNKQAIEHEEERRREGEGRKEERRGENHVIKHAKKKRIGKSIGKVKAGDRTRKPNSLKPTRRIDKE